MTSESGRGNRCLDYLEHMLEAMRLVSGYVEGLSKDDFLADKRTQQAVILNIIVIGEAAWRMAISRLTWTLFGILSANPCLRSNLKCNK